MDVIAIAGVARDGRTIAHEGKIPWHYPEDMRVFQRFTTGCVVIMGRKTFDTLPKVLKDRINVVVSRTGPYGPCNTEKGKFFRVGAIEDALKIAQMADVRRACIIGGAEIYREAMKYVSSLILCTVPEDIDGDTKIDWNKKDWRLAISYDEERVKVDQYVRLK